MSKEEIKEELEEKEELERKEALKKIEEKINESTVKYKESEEAMREGKGILTLEKPIKARGKDITELKYDFNTLTGMEYIQAMDSDTMANQIFKITSKQALNLFAIAVENSTPDVDKQDVLSQIAFTDAAIATMYTTLFFTATVRAGKMRISRK